MFEITWKRGLIVRWESGESLCAGFIMSGGLEETTGEFVVMLSLYYVCGSMCEQRNNNEGEE